MNDDKHKDFIKNLRSHFELHDSEMNNLFLKLLNTEI